MLTQDGSVTVNYFSSDDDDDEIGKDCVESYNDESKGLCAE